MSFASNRKPQRGLLGRLLPALFAAPLATAAFAAHHDHGHDHDHGHAAQPALNSKAKTGGDSAAVPHLERRLVDTPERAPLPANRDFHRQDYDQPETLVPSVKRPSASLAKAAAACDIGKFATASGSALVSLVKSVDTDCINSLFTGTGSNARAIFREAQMVTIANALATAATNYRGINADGILQLIMFLRAGYYVQYSDSSVGSYGPALVNAIRPALDAFVSNSSFGLVNDVHGEILAEYVTLIDSSGQNARYLKPVVQRVLNSYNSSHNQYYWMKVAVNNTYTVLFRGHQNDDFKALVQADNSIIDTLYNFINNNFSQLGSDADYLFANAGRELGRFLKYDGSFKGFVQSRAKPLALRSSSKGVTAPLWVALGEMVDYYDKTNCNSYNLCNYKQRLETDVLPITHSCSPTLRIRAQQMTTSELDWACQRVAGQETFFHQQAATNRVPVANDNNTALEMVVFNSSKDYGTYAGALFGIDTNNGGMYLEGNPASPTNQARFIAYEAEWLPTFDIWNLTHEYVHYLDGRFNMYGDFSAAMSQKTVWWVEGFAEYMSYSYRNLPYTAAQNEAARGTYALSTIFQNTYNSGTTRVYNWGYLANRFMFEKHRGDVTSILGYFRPGNYTGYASFMANIGTRYDAEFRSWLTCVGTPTAPGCGGGNGLPTANFSVATTGLTANFTDGSSDSDGSIASRLWSFGDGTTSTATNPSKTYSAAGTYTVQLKVTDNAGGTATTSKSVTVSNPIPECSSNRTDELGKNCSRSNVSATTGNYAYFFIYVPANTPQLRITTSGGTGNANLYYNSRTWATTSSYQASSTNAGNSETLTISNPPAGYLYISLHAASSFSGVKVTTQY